MNDERFENGRASAAHEGLRQRQKLRCPGGSGRGAQGRCSFSQQSKQLQCCRLVIKFNLTGMGEFCPSNQRCG